MKQDKLPIRGISVQLTKRQAEVLQCVADRLTLKQTASKLGISESAVNQHIKALKRQLGVNSLSELAELWRKADGISDDEACRISACRNSRLPTEASIAASDLRNEQSASLTFREPLTFHHAAPWEGEDAEFVPGALRGINGKWNRASAIVLIAVGVLALVMLALGVGHGINAVFYDPSEVPPEQI